MNAQAQVQLFRWGATGTRVLNDAATALVDYDLDEYRDYLFFEDEPQPDDKGELLSTY